MKSDPALGRAMTQAHVGDNAAFLTGRGIEPTPGNIYLSHFAGPEGAAAILGAKPDAPVASVLPPSALAANPFLSKMTVGDLQQWASGKMGATAPAVAPSAAPNPQMAQPVAAPSVGGGEAPTMPVQADAGMPANDPSAALANVFQQFQQQPEPPAPQPLPLNLAEAPGLTRARMLSRAMALRAISGGTST